MRHGHFLQMGGFTLVDPDRKDAEPKERKGTVLTIDYIRENPTIDIPEITADSIQDRSKGDVLYKLIAILQTTWFIIQCVARGQQRLALTELELVTLALASLNSVTFWIWWHKALGVQDPVTIYLKTEVRIVDDAARPDISYDGCHQQGLEIHQIICKRGGLAHNGDFWYPVRLIQHHEKEKTWSVHWWKGCDFGVLPSAIIIPGSITQIQEGDIVDSLWGDRMVRRAIRVRSLIRKHKITTQISISLESGPMQMKYQVPKTFLPIHPLPPTCQIFMRPFPHQLKLSNPS